MPARKTTEDQDQAPAEVVKTIKRPDGIVVEYVKGADGVSRRVTRKDGKVVGKDL